MHGILLVDKPAGITSHTVISKLRKKLGTKKIGHAGTLDPLATGLLVVCVGHATKISGFVTDSDKSYIAGFQLGKSTTTFDAEGEIVEEKDSSSIIEKNVLRALEKFRGPISQKPPIFSAIKIQGKKLYEYARANQEIEIPTRNVVIHSLELISFENSVGTLKMNCSKGTYVRSLIHDLGQALGVGAFATSIRRIRSNPFSIEKAVVLETLLEMDLEKITEKFIPVCDALSTQFHTIQVSNEEKEKITHGIKFSKTNQNEKFSPDQMILFVSSDNNQGIAIGQWGESDSIRIKRVL